MVNIATVHRNIGGVIGSQSRLYTTMTEHDSQAGVSDGQQSQWLRRHAMIAPLGIILVLVGLMYVRDANQNGIVATAAGMVELATVIWAAFATLGERGVNIMFWAWEQHKKREAERIRLENERVQQQAIALVQAFLNDAEADGLVTDDLNNVWRRILEQQGANPDEMPADARSRAVA